MFQTALRAVYPPECLLCRDTVDTEFGLCGSCWGQTPFLGGALCNVCGAAQPGPAEDDIICDDCLQTPRSWSRGRAALAYSGKGREIVLGLKHGDRHDLARPAALWMARAAAPLLSPQTLIVPVPLHWRRMAKRRYNQSALLAQALARETGLQTCQDLLMRPHTTPSLDGKSAKERAAVMAKAIQINPRRRHRIAGGRPVLLVDDVLTTGATLNACACALRNLQAPSQAPSQAGEICVIVLARAARDT